MGLAWQEMEFSKEETSRFNRVERERRDLWLWDDITVRAARRANMPSTRWLRELGYQVSTVNTMKAAICTRDIDYIGYLMKGYTWPGWVYETPAGSGNLALIKWLRQQGCEWSSLALEIAITNGHHEVAYWMMSNGCERGTKRIISYPNIFAGMKL